MALGFTPQVALAEVRQFKLARATETRNTCPYCSVACGVLMYSLGDGAKNAKPSIYHIEGDADHPVNRGTLCPKGAGLLDFVNSKSRLLFPEYRAPNSKEWTRISWDDALDRIAKLLKADPTKTSLLRRPTATRQSPMTTGMLALRQATKPATYGESGAQSSAWWIENRLV